MLKVHALSKVFSSFVIRIQSQTVSKRNYSKLCRKQQSFHRQQRFDFNFLKLTVMSMTQTRLEATKSLGEDKSCQALRAQFCKVPICARFTFELWIPFGYFASSLVSSFKRVWHASPFIQQRISSSCQFPECQLSFEAIMIFRAQAIKRQTFEAFWPR